MMTFNDIGQMIRYFRKQSGLTQLQLAQLADIGKTVVFDIEKGKETIQLKNLFKVLDVLNIQIKFETPYAQEPENDA